MNGALVAQWLACPPHPPIKHIRGCMHVPIFSGKWVLFGRLSWEYLQIKPSQVGINQWLSIPEIGGIYFLKMGGGGGGGWVQVMENEHRYPLILGRGVGVVGCPTYLARPWWGSRECSWFWTLCCHPLLGRIVGVSTHPWCSRFCLQRKRNIS